MIDIRDLYTMTENERFNWLDKNYKKEYKIVTSKEFERISNSDRAVVMQGVPSADVLLAEIGSRISHLQEVIKDPRNKCDKQYYSGKVNGYHEALSLIKKLTASKTV